MSVRHVLFEKLLCDEEAETLWAPLPTRNVINVSNIVQDSCEESYFHDNILYIDKQLVVSGVTILTDITL